MPGMNETALEQTLLYADGVDRTICCVAVATEMSWKTAAHSGQRKLGLIIARQLRERVFMEYTKQQKGNKDINTFY